MSDIKAKPGQDRHVQAMFQETLSVNGLSQGSVNT